jgi:transposase
MESSQSIPAAEVERMMKLQDVLLKAMAKRISWLSAAEIIGVTPRTMRRWRERMEEQGYDGLRDGEKGRPASGGWRWKLAKRFCGCTRRSTWT